MEWTQENDRPKVNYNQRLPRIVFYSPRIQSRGFRIKKTLESRTVRRGDGTKVDSDLRHFSKRRGTGNSGSPSLSKGVYDQSIKGNWDSRRGDIDQGNNF